MNLKTIIYQAVLFTLGMVTIPVLTTGIVTDFWARSFETAAALNDVAEEVRRGAWIAFVGAFLVKEAVWRKAGLTSFMGRAAGFIGVYFVLFVLVLAVI